MPAPAVTKEKIGLHRRAYQTALKDQSQILLRSLENSYKQFQPLLHSRASDPNLVDTDALIYSLLRLPPEIDQAATILMAPTPETFTVAGFSDVESWQKVSAPSRRRRSYFNRQKTISFFLASVSDLDDLVNLLLAYQIEWNKFHSLLKKHCSANTKVLSFLSDPEHLSKLGIAPEVWPKILKALGPKSEKRLLAIFHRPRSLRLRLLAGSWIDYARSVQRWWKSLAKRTSPRLHLSHLEIYLVSSNLHSILNLASPYNWKIKGKILNHFQKNYPHLLNAWQNLYSLSSHASRNLLHHASKFYYQDNPQEEAKKERFEKKLGIFHLPSQHYFDINVQLIPLSLFAKKSLIDPALTVKNPSLLAKSQAYIINVDYPLGFAAYHLTNEVLENVTKMKGLYVLGKAAVLNSEPGDLQIPRLVFDEHSQNSYLFENCFNQSFPFELKLGSLLTQQKAASVLGTFLENQNLIDSYLAQNFTVIEMENGPFLSAVTEATFPTRFPSDTIVPLSPLALDLGIINYTSDTPYSKAKNLGNPPLSLEGVEPVYTASRAILQRIISQEEKSY